VKPPPLAQSKRRRRKPAPPLADVAISTPDFPSPDAVATRAPTTRFGPQQPAARTTPVGRAKPACRARAACTARPEREPAEPATRPTQRRLGPPRVRGPLRRLKARRPRSPSPQSKPTATRKGKRITSHHPRILRLNCPRRPSHARSPKNFPFSHPARTTPAPAWYKTPGRNRATTRSARQSAQQPEGSGERARGC